MPGTTTVADTISINRIGANPITRATNAGISAITAGMLSMASATTTASITNTATGIGTTSTATTMAIIMITTTIVNTHIIVVMRISYLAFTQETWASFFVTSLNRTGRQHSAVGRYGPGPVAWCKLGVPITVDDTYEKPPATAIVTAFYADGAAGSRANNDKPAGSCEYRPESISRMRADARTGGAEKLCQL